MRYIAFVQREGTAGSYSSVRVWDAQTAETFLASGNGGGVPANTVARSPSISPDGRFVAFLSDSTNLVGSPVNPEFHIYVRDLQLGETRLVDVDLEGAGSTDHELASFSISADGRFVAFSSPDGMLADQDNNRFTDIFVRDTIGSVTELTSKRYPGIVSASAAGGSFISQMALTADGRSAVFASRSDELLPDNANQVRDIYLRDLPGNANILLSACSDGSPAAAGFSGSPAASADGRFVVFVSTVPNLLPGQTITNGNVYLRDMAGETTSLVSLSTNGVGHADRECFDPAVSRDGRYVFFAGPARNLAPGAGSGINTFWRDIHAHVTVALPGPNYYRYSPSMSSDGRYVAYCAASGSQSQLIVRDMQLAKDIYTNAAVVTAAALSPSGNRLLYNVSGTVSVFDLIGGTNVISFSSPVNVWSPSVWSADGRFVTYIATTNAATNLYLCDLSTRAATLVSSNYQPIGPITGDSDSPVISADGRFVAYRSYATNIVVGGNGPAPNIYLFDRLTGTNAHLIFGQANSSSFLYHSKPIMSQSGGAVAFVSLGSSLVANDLNRQPDAFAISLDAGMPPDSDADGIPDWWMALYFGQILAQSGDLSRAQDDADADGLTNGEEWIVETNPRSAASSLRLWLTSVSDSGVQLTWESANGVIYELQRSSDLGSHPAFLSIQNVVGQVGTTSFTDTNNNAAGSCFYRVSVH